MSDENDASPENLLEGGEEIFSALDGLDFPDQAATDTTATTTTEQAENTEQQEEKSQDTSLLDDAAGSDKTTAQQQPDKSKVATTDADKGKKDYPENIKSTKARHDFDLLRKSRDDERKRAETAESRYKEATTKTQQLEARIKELETTSGASAPEVKVLQSRVEELQKQLEEKEGKLGLYAVEETQPYQEHVLTPQTEAMQEMDDIAETYDLDGKALADILREPNRHKRMQKLADLTEGMPDKADYAKADLRTAVEKFAAAEVKKHEIMRNAQGSREFAARQKQEQEAKQNLQRVETYKKATQEVTDTVKAKIAELSGDEATWNDILSKASKVADYDKMDPKAKAFGNMAAHMIVPLLNKLRAEVKAHNSTKEVLAKRQAATPGAGGGRDGGVDKGDNEETDFMSVVDRAFAKA